MAFEEKEWELDQLEKLKEEQEAEIDEDNEPLFYESTCLRIWFGGVWCCWNREGPWVGVDAAWSGQGMGGGLGSRELVNSGGCV